MLLTILLFFQNSVLLIWSPNTEADLKGYVAHWGTKSKSYSNELDVGLKTSAVISDLKNKTYYFAVTAYDTVGNISNYSDEVFHSFEIITPPTIVKNYEKIITFLPTGDVVWNKKTWPADNLGWVWDSWALLFSENNDYIRTGNEISINTSRLMSFNDNTRLWRFAAGGDTTNWYLIEKNVVGIPEVDTLLNLIFHEPYPNPFNENVTISLELPENASVSISIHNGLGQKIDTFGRFSTVGIQMFTWFPSSKIAKGVFYAYFTIKIKGNTYTRIQKLVYN